MMPWTILGVLCLLLGLGLLAFRLVVGRDAGFAPLAGAAALLAVSVAAGRRVYFKGFVAEG